LLLCSLGFLVEPAAERISRECSAARSGPLRSGADVAAATNQALAAAAHEKLADVEEATEQRMHSVADLLPQGEQIHERADRLSESAEKHRRRAQHSRDDDDERDG
jgi:hypothetical protein